jgi:endonuclease YncB( thermonuclease family)
MLDPKKVKSTASAIERYARKNIPESSKAFGEFMYHAELLKKGHIAVHRQDAQKLPAKYQDVIRQIWDSKTGS